MSWKLGPIKKMKLNHEQEVEIYFDSRGDLMIEVGGDYGEGSRTWLNEEEQRELVEFISSGERPEKVGNNETQISKS